MNRRQKQRLYFILLALTLLGLAAGLVLYALRQNINLFYTPTSLLTHPPAPEQVIRMGGMVERGSVHYATSGKSVRFRITDGQHTLAVRYAGVLPTLFREGQGTVMTGSLNAENIFMASEVLAKHDEKYRPPVGYLKGKPYAP